MQTDSDHLEEKWQTAESGPEITMYDTICIKTGRELPAERYTNYLKNQVDTTATNHTWQFKLKLISVK